MQVKITPYRFTRLLARLVSIGPKLSIPTFEKVGRSGLSLSFGKSAIFCIVVLPATLLQTTHLFIIRLMAEFAFVIQYFL